MPGLLRGRAATLTALLFAGAGYYLLVHARDLARFPWQFHAGWLGLAVVFVIAAGPLSRVWSWYLALRRLGAVITPLECFRIMRLSQLAKYLPGSLWHYVGLLYLAHRAGIARGTAVASLLYDQGASLMAAGLVALPLTAVSASLGSYHAVWMVAGACLVLGIVLVHPGVISHGAGLAVRFAGPRVMRWVRGYMERLPSLPSGHVGELVALNVGSWVILGASLYFLVLATTGRSVPLADAIVIGSTGVVAGFLAPFAPSGIGITEGVMVVLLSSFLPLEVCVAIALLFRVLNVVKEILLAAVALKVEGQTRPTVATEAC